MPHRRPGRRGSFVSRFDELVTHFPAEEKIDRPARPTERSAELQEKLDIHHKLFERAWRIEDDWRGAR
ncbi:MAG: hypothetical protein ACM3ZV_09865 [Bacillota bacterium]